MSEQYHGKRFLAFMVTAFLLAFCAAGVPAENYPSFATAIGLAFGAYATGQSATDWKENG